MDIYDMYIAKNESTQIHLPSVKDTFISSKNKEYLSKIISKQLYVTNNDDRYKQLRIDVNNEVDNWVNTGNLNKLAGTADIVSYELTLRLNYYNNMFIKHYINKNTKLDQYQYELDNNPYHQVSNINGEKKQFKDFLASDYENMDVSNYHETFTHNGLFNERYNKIPFYRKMLHNRNIDRSTKGNNMHFDSKINVQYKKYDNNELLNNLSYLRTNNKKD